MLVQKELKNAYIGIPNPTSIVLDKSSITLTTIGQTEQLTATIEPIVSDKTITWSSDDITVATVSTTGLVTCVTPGTCTITAITANGLTASCNVKAGLPSAYQEVEYIESSGTQWIDTGVTPIDNTLSQIKVRFLAYTGDVIYGYRASDDNTAYRFFNAYGRPNGTTFNKGACIFDGPYSTQTYTRIETGSGVLSLNTDYELEIGNYYIQNMSTQTNIVSGTTGTLLATNSITLNHSESGGNSQNRWYYVKIWNGATQVRDLVPCYRIADTEIGMYDKVNGVFYANDGTGTFTKGNDVN